MPHPQEIFGHYGNEEKDGAPSERNTLFRSLSKEAQVRRRPTVPQPWKMMTSIFS